MAGIFFAFSTMVMPALSRVPAAKAIAAMESINVVTIVAWAGVGKSTLINHWLRRMAADHYRSAELIFGWSFYRQGTSGETFSLKNSLIQLSVGLEIRIHGWDRPGRKGRDSRSSLRINESY